jgi:hypothetical protein
MQIKVTYGKGFEPKQALTATFANMGLATIEVTPDKIVRLQDELLKMDQADIVTEHTFTSGIYERKIIVPPWCVLTGAPHKTAYKVRLEKGTIAVNIGTEVKILTAPLEFDASAGEQRVGRVFDEEVVWVDIYENSDDCQDISVLEDRLYVVPKCGLGENRRKLIAAKKQEQLMLQGEA